MKRFLLLVFLLSVAVLLTGCFQTNIAIKVNPDGSGTLEQTVLIRKDVMNQMRSISKSLAKEGEAPQELNLLNEDDLKATAKKLGEGVSYVKATPIDNANYEGYKALFAFKDIEKLDIDQNPSGSLPSDDSQKPTPPEFITFKLKKGKTAKLTIIMPKESTAEKAPAKDQQESAEAEKKQEQSTAPADKKSSQAQQAQQEQMMAAMMKEMMKGMKVSISVEMNGKVKKTNATFQDGNRITLMDIDFDKLLASKEQFAKFVKTNPESMSAAKGILKSIPGIKMEMKPVVKVEFK